MVGALGSHPRDRAPAIPTDTEFDMSVYQPQRTKASGLLFFGGGALIADEEA